jgi:hypothetical protein
MRKLRITLIALLLLGLFIAPAAASPEKPVIAILPVVNNASQKNTGYLIEMINDALSAKFGQDRYQLMGGQYLQDSFRRQGVEDYRSLDKSTLNLVLNDMWVDYSIRTEILPIVARQRIDFPDIFLFMKTWVADVSFSCTITNVRTGAVMYDAVISDFGKHESIIGFANREYAIRMAMARVLDKFQREPIMLE